MTKQITLTYCGRRLSSSNKLIFEFDYEGRALLFTKSRHGTIGGKYTVDAEVAGEGDEARVRIYPDSLCYAGEKIDDVDQIAVWEAADRDSWNTSRLLATERKHAKSSELDAALEPAIRIIQKASTRAEAQAVIRVVTEKLDRAWWERRP